VEGQEERELRNLAEVEAAVAHLEQKSGEAEAEEEQQPGHPSPPVVVEVEVEGARLGIRLWST
jgi:hypothetical protein